MKRQVLVGLTPFIKVAADEFLNLAQSGGRIAPAFETVASALDVTRKIILHIEAGFARVALGAVKAAKISTDAINAINKVNPIAHLRGTTGDAAFTGAINQTVAELEAGVRKIEAAAQENPAADLLAKARAEAAKFRQEVDKAGKAVIDIGKSGPLFGEQFAGAFD